MTRGIILISIAMTIVYMMVPYEFAIAAFVVNFPLALYSS